MTEAVWNNCAEPQAMVRWLSAKGTLTDRKARLFSVAVCRRIWHLLTDERSRRAVEVAERYAEGSVCRKERNAVRLAASEAVQAAIELERVIWSSCTEQDVKACNNAYSAIEAAQAAAHSMFKDAHEAADMVLWSTNKAMAGDATERAAQAAVLRDLLGPLPFRVVTIDPLWLTPSVLALARLVFDERAFERLPELGDALEAAGCNNEAMLGHCREEGHVKGCWVVDMLLGREGR